MPALPGEHGVDLATARSMAAFPIEIPTSLGPADRTTVSDGTPPRVVALTHLAAGTLAWQVGTVTLRLEGSFTEQQALAIAAATRWPGTCSDSRTCRVD